MAKKTNLDHTELLVLSLLAQEDMYGYQMIAELARQSDHTFEMKEGAISPALHTLEHGGPFRPTAPPPPPGRSGNTTT